MCYEAYIMLDVEGIGVAKLHRVIKAGNTLLDEEVDRRPFITFVRCRHPMRSTDRTSQRSCALPERRTVLTCSILDHAMITK